MKRMENQSSDNVLISEKGIVNYSVVYPEKALTIAKLMDAINALLKTLAESADAPSVKSTMATPSQYSAITLEILVGDTGYPETEAVKKELAYGDWKICFYGHKLVVAAYSRYALIDAIEALIELIQLNGNGEGTVSLALDTMLIGTHDALINALPRCDDGTVSGTIYESRDCSLAVHSSMTADTYRAYLTKLEAEGYTYYTENSIGNNLYHIYQNHEYVIHTRYFGNLSEARFNIEKKTTLVGLESENVYTPNPLVVTSLAQVGVTGSSDCYQLADGSFLVIDGGHTHDGPALYEYMKSKAPNGKIVVAAWILTHGDGDHIGCICRFRNAYQDEVDLEMVIKNFPSDETGADSGSREKSNVYDVAVNWQGKGCKLVKAHAGQKFYIRDAVVEVLLTIGDIAPDPILKYNDTSMVFTVDVAGERALFTADMSQQGAKMCVDAYGKYLKCDLMTIPHHGITNGYKFYMPNSVEFMTFARPEIVFWPHKSLQVHLGNPLRWIELCSWNAEVMKSAREIYISGSGFPTVLELPYRPFSAYRYDPDETREPVRLERASATDSLEYAVAVNAEDVDRVSWGKS